MMAGKLRTRGKTLPGFDSLKSAMRGANYRAKRDGMPYAVITPSLHSGVYTHLVTELFDAGEVCDRMNARLKVERPDDWLCYVQTHIVYRTG